MIRIMKRYEDLKERVENFLDSGKPSAQITKVALALIFVAGVLTITAMAPNVFQVFGRRYKKVGKYEKRQFQKNMFYLKKKGFVEVIKESDDKTIVRITRKGQQKLIEYSIDEMEIKKPEKWDRKWRMVIFDVPNKYKTARDALRKKLKEMGFYQLQKSVWVYPYPCFDEILFIGKFFNAERFIELLTVEEMINDDKLLRCFRLQS